MTQFVLPERFNALPDCLKKAKAMHYDYNHSAAIIPFPTAKAKPKALEMSTEELEQLLEDANKELEQATESYTKRRLVVEIMEIEEALDKRKGDPEAKIVEFKSARLQKLAGAADEVESGPVSETVFMVNGDLSFSSGDYWAGPDAVAPQHIYDFLNKANGREVTFYINSGGGSIFGSEAMCEHIRNYDKKTTAYGTGVIASAAVPFALSTDYFKISKGSQLMVHESWTGVVGNKRALRSAATAVENFDQFQVELYNEKTNLGEAKLNEYLEAETWMSAEKALKDGFVDEITDPKKRDTSKDDKGRQEARKRATAFRQVAAQSEMLAFSNFSLVA